MKILVGYRGTKIGKELLELAVEHASAFAGEIFLITSLPGGGKTSSKQVIEAEKNLKNAEQFLDKHSIKNETHLLVRGKNPGEDIVAFAKENNCYEIIIGVKSRSKVGKILFGSTAQFVILKASCPVVSVK